LTLSWPCSYRATLGRASVLVLNCSQRFCTSQWQTLLRSVDIEPGVLVSTTTYFPSFFVFFFFSSRRRHTRSKRDWSSDVCSSDLIDVSLDVLIHGTSRKPAHPGLIHHIVYGLIFELEILFLPSFV